MVAIETDSVAVGAVFYVQLFWFPATATVTNNDGLHVTATFLEGRGNFDRPEPRACESGAGNEKLPDDVCYPLGTRHPETSRRWSRFVVNSPPRKRRSILRRSRRSATTQKVTLYIARTPCNGVLRLRLDFFHFFFFWLITHNRKKVYALVVQTYAHTHTLGI